MKKKIAIAGLYSLPNMGDLLLCDTARYLACKADDSIEIVELDVYPTKRTDRTFIEKIERRISSRKIRKAKKKFEYSDGSEKRYRYERRMWKLQVRRYYEKKLKDVDAVIFAGGGFIKFRTQGLNYYAEMIIELAEKYDIPVMMNAVGIEGYDPSDYRCISLKKHINSPVVRTITTRDNIGLLNDSYVVNKDIVTARVGDPALWSQECLGIVKNPDATRIGVNIIRGNIFKDYGNRLSLDEMKDFYMGLIEELEKRGQEWMLFSNGMKSDVKFGRKVLEELGMDENEKMIPAPTASAELLDIIRDCKCVFGARLHACITAYALDVPVVGFIWNEKTEMFAEQIKKEGNFFREDELDPAAVADRLIEAAEEKYEDGILEQNRNLTFEYLRDFVENVKK